MEKLLSLVVPAFNEEEAMEQSFERTYRAMSSIGYPFEIIYIDDGSRDRTWEIISRLAREHEEVKALRFSRNFGHQLAVTAGMDEAKGDAVIIMDADLQDPPEVIADMVKAWEQGADIANAPQGRDCRKEVYRMVLLQAAELHECVSDTLGYRRFPAARQGRCG